MGKNNIIIEDELDESYYNPEKGWERFKETLDIRLRIQDEMRRFLAGEVTLANYPDDDDEIVKASILDRFIIIIRSSTFKKIGMVASLVLMLFIGGVAGTCAQQRGFFETVIDNEDKNYSALMPTKNDSQFIYNTIDMVPIKHIRFLWTPNNIPEDLSLKSITVTEYEYNIKAICEYKINKTFVTATKDTYENNLVLSDQLYDGFKILKEETISAINIEYYSKENDDYTEYMALFSDGNSRYILNTNCALEVLEDIIKNSIENKCL